jgi:hypothetical protein
MTQVSTRNPDLFEKESDRLAGVSRGAAGQPAPEVYVRQKKPVVREKSRDNETGSLYSPDDARNYLFAPSGPHNVGRFLAINVVANRGPAKPGEPAAAPDAKAGEGDETEQELLKALPDLAPKAPGEPSLVKTFKMQIVHRFDNGDVLARMARRSQDEDQAAEITAEARIPYDKLASGDPLTTEDLLDVSYVESAEGELIERSSSGWEDEYSLRLSGFSEAKSKAAADLVDQKKQLEEAKEKLETKIKAFGEERKQVAKQREDFAKKNADADQKVKSMQTQIDDQKSTIDDQQKKIEQLSPEDKPSDAKEGAGGG